MEVFMKYTSHQLMIFLMTFYGLLEAKVVDFHIVTPGEEYQMEQNQKQQDIDKATEILHDETGNSGDQWDALQTLVELGGIS